MKLLIIYGPPAAGKLTVAKEVAKRTNFKLFHNHATVDLYALVMPFGVDDFWDRVAKIRYEIIELATKYDVNLIYTVCYDHPKDAHYFNELIKLVEEHHSEVYFAQLACKQEELMRRVTGDSRKQYGKMIDPAQVKKATDQGNYYAPVKHEHIITIDNTDKGPEEVAELIIKEYGLDSPI